MTILATIDSVVAGISAPVIGYAIGTVPTAVWLGRAAGIDLRGQGSGNPGAANALRTGGTRLAAAVLGVEMAKGAAAVWVGSTIGSDFTALLAGLGAVTGNLYNIYFRFRGGKGLGIAAGVLLAAWPTVLIPIVAIIALGAWATRSSGAAAVIAALSIVVLAASWVFFDFPTAWGISDPVRLMALAIGLAGLIVPRHWGEARFGRSHPA